MIHRRTFLTGLLAAPIIVRAGIIMPVKPLDEAAWLDSGPIDLNPGAVNWVPMSGLWRGQRWEWRAEGCTAFLRPVLESSNISFAS
jgi:hypothetical protein